MIKFFKTEKKEHPNGGAFFMPNTQSYTFKKDKRAYIKEGYEQNVIVYRAVREITTGIADIEIEVHKDGEYLENNKTASKALDLLQSPNPSQGFNQFVKQIFTDYLLTGEMFIARSENSGAPAELWPLNPINMHVVSGKTGLPKAYVHDVNNVKKTFPVDKVSGKCDVFMLKMYNPLDHWRGLAPLSAAALAADTHNEGIKWNYSLLKNGARPSGILQAAGDVTSQTVSRLQEFFKKQYQGASNAGEVPLLTNGIEWKSTDNTPRDMDYLLTMKEMSKYIASAFGVPLPLIDNDAASYNNIEQAKERLWTDTILPLFNEFLNAFGNWLMPYYFGIDAKSYTLVPNLDDIPALEGVRTRRFDRMIMAVEKGVLTADEARRAIGYDPRGGLADMLMVSSSQIPVDMIDQDISEKQFNYLFDDKK